MDSFSFKNIKFIKSKEPSNKKKMNKSPVKQNEKRISFWKKLIQNPFLFLFFFVIILAYFISYLPSKSLPNLIEGEIASSDIIAPFDLTIIDEETTENRKQEAVKSILPVYSLDANVFLNLEEKIRSFFTAGRELIKKSVSSKAKSDFIKEISEKYGLDISTNILDALIKNKFTKNIEENLVSLIGKISVQGIILSKTLFIHGEREKGLILVLGSENEKTASVDELLDISEKKKRICWHQFPNSS